MKSRGCSNVLRLEGAHESGGVHVTDSIRQLGLKLEDQKAMIETLIVDDAAKPSAK